MPSWHVIALWVGSLGDAWILIRWGIDDHRKKEHADARRLIRLALCTLLTFVAGLAGEAERVRVEQELQALNEVYQLADDAELRSTTAYEQLGMIAGEDSPRAARAKQRVTLMQRELAYYEQPLGMVLGSYTVTLADGQQLSGVKIPTDYLFAQLRRPEIQRETRMLVVKVLADPARPAGQVDARALELLRNAENEDLHAVAATTGVLRRRYGTSLEFMDVLAWMKFLEPRVQHAPVGP